MPEKTLQEKLRPEGKELQVTRPKIDQNGMEITLSCATEGVTIGYKLNNTSPNADGWQLYKGAFSVASGDTLRVIADRIGYRYAVQEVIINSK